MKTKYGLQSFDAFSTPRLRLFLIVLYSVIFQLVIAKDYYVHPLYGNDQNDGTSKQVAVQTLNKVSQFPLKSGDRILLASGQVYHGYLRLVKANGVTVESVVWSDGDPLTYAIIDSKGFTNGILIEDCSHIRISLIGITANGYIQFDTTSNMRTGVMVRTNRSNQMKNIILDRLKIYDLFYENMGYRRRKGEVASANGTERYGWGIRLINENPESTIEEVIVKDCEIENISHTGIKLSGRNKNIQRVRILNNRVSYTGGPGIQMSNVRFVYVSGNIVNRSGSNNDSRKWGRGSGQWTWSSSHVLIEKNSFLNANGPGDSAGAHVDFNCDNIILQYNLSANNAGGFCEVLGNNFNCAYRYNISINDGYRIKGEKSAFQEGKMFWLSGYQGNREKKGPINTYFYNNTIFVREDIVSKIAIDRRAEGVLIANNIFCLLGGSKMVKGDQQEQEEGDFVGVDRVYFRNNLFLRNDTWPKDAPLADDSPLLGDPQFKNPGGLSAVDYTPNNKEIGNGILIPFLPGDDFGLMQGLQLEYDFLGNKIAGRPGIGAIHY